MKYLYVCEKKLPIEESKEMDIRCVQPSFWKSTNILNEKISIKSFLVRKLFTWMSKGEMLIFSAYNASNQLMHTSYVVPRCWKFPYLHENEYEIGPCHTFSQFRGRGIYPRILRHIVSTVGTEETKFYMVVNSNNESSIRGIEKAGFSRIGIMEVRGITKRYYIKNKESEE